MCASLVDAKPAASSLPGVLFGLDPLAAGEQKVAVDHLEDLSLAGGQRVEVGGELRPRDESHCWLREVVGSSIQVVGIDLFHQSVEPNVTLEVAGALGEKDRLVHGWCVRWLEEEP